MTSEQYALGTSETARRRLEVQDSLFGPASDSLVDSLDLQPGDRVVELGCGPGGLSRRVFPRLGPDGCLVLVDFSAPMLEAAREGLAGLGPARVEAVSADIRELGEWLDGADVVLGRTVLHHVPLAETMLGRLYTRLDRGTRIGFLEPEFRAPAARVARLAEEDRERMEPLINWALGITGYYQSLGLSPSIGATLPLALEQAGFEQIEAAWHEFPVDERVTENMLLFYEEVGPRYIELGVQTAEEIEAQKRALASMDIRGLPPAWGVHRVTARA